MVPASIPSSVVRVLRSLLVPCVATLVSSSLGGQPSPAGLRAGTSSGSSLPGRHGFHSRGRLAPDLRPTISAASRQQVTVHSGTAWLGLDHLHTAVGSWGSTPSTQGPMLGGFVSDASRAIRTESVGIMAGRRRICPVHRLRFCHVNIKMACASQASADGSAIWAQRLGQRQRECKYRNQRIIPRALIPCVDMYSVWFLPSALGGF
jgi:hypothetical protein